MTFWRAPAIGALAGVGAGAGPVASAGRARPTRGFTAIEVLIAMTILVIGAAGVMSMQKASIQANLDARRMDVANSIARTWLERLQMDAMRWTAPNLTNTASNLANTLILNNAITSNGTWFLPAGYTPAGATAPLSYQFDILGRDIAPTATGVPVIFCAEVRLTWLVNNVVTTATSVVNDQLIRGDVRVYWPRGLSTVSSPTGFCTAAQSANGPDPTAYGSVYATTAIRENPSLQ
jgi:prepilin-type N-terminal cleavage/methylation domain-containing protein